MSGGARGQEVGWNGWNEEGQEVRVGTAPLRGRAPLRQRGEWRGM